MGGLVSLIDNWFWFLTKDSGWCCGVFIYDVMRGVEVVCGEEVEKLIAR